MRALIKGATIDGKPCVALSHASAWIITDGRAKLKKRMVFDIQNRIWKSPVKLYLGKCSLSTFEDVIIAITAYGNMEPPTMDELKYDQE